MGRLEEAVLPAIVALLVAAIVGDVLILSFGQNPGHVYRLLLDGTWGNAYGFGQVLYKATTLTFTGLAVAIGLRAGLFNIGAESQLAAGGFVAALVGLLLPRDFPRWSRCRCTSSPRRSAAASVGGIPGVLKARFGAHEVITTIMLNFIVLALLNYLTAAHLKVAGHAAHGGDPRRRAAAALGVRRRRSTARRRTSCCSSRSPRRRVRLVPVPHAARLRAARVGLQPEAAEYGGVDVGGVWWRAMVLSGALAGIGGLNFVLGYKHYYEEAFASARASSASRWRSSDGIIPSASCWRRSCSRRCRRAGSP